MSELPPDPPIDPTTFDLIVIGTGLPNSIIAAAASAASKTVLHLDPNPFYGSHFASLPLPDLSFLNSYSTPPHSLPSTPSDGHDHNVVHVTSKSLYSGFEISNYAPELLEEHSRNFNLDLAGPRVLFCADKVVDHILRSNANQYVEFKSVDASFVCDENGKLVSVPDSRAAIFKDKSLGLREKNMLMRFFKLVQQHLASDGGGDEINESGKISEEDLESLFVEFLKKTGLPPKIKSYRPP